MTLNEINELSLLVDEIVNLTSTGFKSENFVTDDLSVIAQEVAEKFSRRSGRTINITSSEIPYGIYKALR